MISLLCACALVLRTSGRVEALETKPGPQQWFACRPGSGPCNPKPKWPPSYLMNASTSIMVLNSDGTLDSKADILRHWGLVDIGA